jgi:hypothetical protein
MKTEDRYEKGPCTMDVLKGTVPYLQRYAEQFGGDMWNRTVNLYICEHV